MVNYIPNNERTMTDSKFTTGDTVRIKDNYFNSAKRGKEGVVISLDGDNKFLTGLVTVKLTSGELMSLTEISLELVDKKPVEGETIARRDIKVGQTIRVTFSTEIGSYTQTSTKEGVVTRIKNAGIGVGEIPIVQPEESEISLSFGSSREVFTLIKDAPEVDEITLALHDSKPGSVAQIEDNGFGQYVITYVKTAQRDSVTQTPLWIEQDSRYAASNRSVLESVVRNRLRSVDQIVVSL